MVPYRGLFRFEICEASGLEQNFQTPEGPHQIGRSFQKENPFFRKIETGEQPENTKEKNGLVLSVLT
jgi:hypothetical protein